MSLPLRMVGNCLDVMCRIMCGKCMITSVALRGSLLGESRISLLGLLYNSTNATTSTQFKDNIREQEQFVLS